MLICKECGATFNDEDAGTVQGDRGYFGSARAYEDVAVCPECGCDDLAEAALCPICEEYFNSEDEGIDTSEGAVCPECMKRVKMTFDALILNEFSPAEKAVLAAIEENEALI